MYRETRVYRHFIVVTRRELNMQMKRRTTCADERSLLVLPVDQPRPSISFWHLLAISSTCFVLHARLIARSSDFFLPIIYAIVVLDLNDYHFSVLSFIFYSLLEVLNEETIKRVSLSRATDCCLFSEVSRINGCRL